MNLYRCIRTLDWGCGWGSINAAAADCGAWSSPVVPELQAG